MRDIRDRAYNVRIRTPFKCARAKLPAVTQATTPQPLLVLFALALLRACALLAEVPGEADGTPDAVQPVVASGQVGVGDVLKAAFEVQ